MPYTLKTSQISVKDPETGEYSGVDILAEQTEEGLIAELQAEGTKQVNRINQAAVDVQSAVDKAETDAAKIISDTQISVNALESQKNTIAQTVASMAELGTDTTFTTPGMAADAGAVGDLSRQLSDVEGDLFQYTGNKKIQLTHGAYITLNTATTNVNAPVANASYDYAVVPCSAGDVFTVNATGRVTAKPWGFVASDGTIIKTADAVSATQDTVVKDTVLVAPANSAYLVINTRAGGESAYGAIIEQRVDAIDKASKPCNLFNPVSFAEDSSQIAIFNNGYITISGIDSRKTSDMSYAVYLFANEEYAISVDYTDDWAMTFQISNPSIGTLAYNGAMGSFIKVAKFTPTVSGYHTVKMLSSSASYPFSVCNVFIGKYSDWIESIKNGIIPAFSSNIGDALAINRAIIKANYSPYKKVVIPSGSYTLETSVEVYSGVTLECCDGAILTLDDNADCPMLVNKHRSAVSITDKNITIIGGKWDGNHDNQQKKPDGELTVGFWLCGINGLRLEKCNIVNTRTYGIMINNIKNVIINDIDVAVGDVSNPDNCDGLHVKGPASNIVVSNSRFTSEDNVIALTANDGNSGVYSTNGDIENVTIENVKILNSTGGQGMLFLSAEYKVRNVHLKNISGAAKYFLQMNHWGMVANKYGVYENITIEDVEFTWLKGAGLGFIYMCDGTFRNIKFKNFTINDTVPYYSETSNIIRIYNSSNAPTVKLLNIDYINEKRANALGGTWSFINLINTTAENLIFNQLYSEDLGDASIPIMLSDSTIDKLAIYNSSVAKISNNTWISNTNSTIAKTCIDEYSTLTQ